MNFADALDEITRLRSECNGYEEELASVRAELKAERNKWAEAWKPYTGTALPIYPSSFTSGSVSSEPFTVYGGNNGGSVWTAPAAGEYTITMDATGFISATGMPATLEIISGGKNEKVTVTNVTFEGVKINPVSPILPVPVDEEPHAIEPRKRDYPAWNWNLPPDSSPTGSGASPPAGGTPPDQP